MGDVEVDGLASPTLSADDSTETGTFQVAAASVGAASKLVFSTQPSNTTAGASITPAVQVSVEDANNNVVTTNTSNVTIALGTNPGSGTLGGTLTAAAVNGVATFSNLSINKAGTGYTLTAADGSLSRGHVRARSTSRRRRPASWSSPPSRAARRRAASITPAVQVSVEDANGNVVTTDTSSVTIALGTNPGNGTLGGTLTVAAVNGVATFSNLSINKTGTGYTLTAADGSLSGATPAAFNITPAAASKLVFITQPSNTAAGAGIAPAVQVAVEDADNNVVTTNTSSVTIALGANPGSGTLGGTLTVAAVNGVATFNNLSINKAGTGYTLTAADGSLSRGHFCRSRSTLRRQRPASWSSPPSRSNTAAGAALRRQFRYRSRTPTATWYDEHLQRDDRPGHESRQQHAGRHTDGGGRQRRGHLQQPVDQ